MKNLFLFTLLTLALGFTACSDDNGPSIEINSPANGSVYAAGDVLQISLTASDDMEVSNIDIEGSGGLTINDPLDLTGITDRTNFTVNLDFTLPPTITAGDYSLTFIAADNDGNIAEAELEFTIE